MGLLGWFRKRGVVELEHPDFGRLVHSERQRDWVNRDFTLWGASGLQLVIAGDRSGPTAAQVAAFHELRSTPDVLRRSLAALAEMPQPEGSSGSTFVLMGLSIPRLDDSESGRLWNLWFEKEGDDHYLFGVQSTDGWRTIRPYAED